MHVFTFPSQQDPAKKMVAEKAISCSNSTFSISEKMSTNTFSFLLHPPFVPPPILFRPTSTSLAVPPSSHPVSMALHPGCFLQIQLGPTMLCLAGLSGGPLPG